MQGRLEQAGRDRVGHWRGEGMALVEAAVKENRMASSADNAGRPVVVVTGMGVVTSLGAGKADNWQKLTAGRIGHPRDHPLRHRRA